MSNRDFSESLIGYEKEDDQLWLWDDIPELKMEIGYKIKKLLHLEKSAFQEISIVETASYGRMLVLDGTPQITEKDGFIYNEMISHIALTTHPKPLTAGMIGGGDCGPAREALKYGSVETIDVVEIDPLVVSACRTWMTPYESNDRIRLFYEDGARWIKKQQRQYDVLLVDRSDPYGPATALYTAGFYRDVHQALKDDGIAVFQSGSPFYSDSFKKTVNQLRKLFPIVHTYTTTIPSFPGGIWTFTIASKRWSPLQADLNRLQWENAKYMNPDIFRASFQLPNYIRDMLK
ncbi:polyamine aminopropyltransferase [Paenibacillus sp. NEAU-GSW1]|uniref:polyamine aminopropyltransferase n=1 Tax=Paenibacillus sp. NEAU-GSW1 TaxID=2682486 RepID=UPI0012E150CF|nr:polyamine aminopropyltransferase [Paenibacillus sp. NEAU-GSW1]MUT64793.1 polyamine aminopropyltransferase [Paenibacillus sp. NEAU-GSW1]